MIKVEKKQDNIIIEDIIKIWGADEKQYINLKKVRWKDIPEKIDYFKIEYPGEYHFNIERYSDGIYFTVVEWENRKLNYLIEKVNDKVVAFIQSPSVLESSDIFENVEIWIFEDPAVEEMLDKLEYEWERIKI